MSNERDLAIVRGALAGKTPKDGTNDERAVKRFYRAMADEPFNTQMAAVQWLGMRFVRDKDARMLATARSEDLPAAPVTMFTQTTADVILGVLFIDVGAAFVRWRRRTKARALNRVIRWTLRLQAMLDRELDRQ